MKTRATFFRKTKDSLMRAFSGFATSMALVLMA